MPCLAATSYPYLPSPADRWGNSTLSHWGHPMGIPEEAWSCAHPPPPTGLAAGQRGDPGPSLHGASVVTGSGVQASSRKQGGFILGSLGNSGQWLEAPECGAPAGGTSHPHGISLPLI